MCAPLLAVAGFAASAASSVAGFMGQSAQADAQTQEYEQNQLNAARAYADSSQAIITQQEQEQAQASQQNQQNDLAARAGAATATAGAAAGGVQGISVNELVGAYSMKDALAKSATATQLQWNLAQGQNEKTAAGDQQVGRINSMQPGIQPSPLSAALGIATAGVNAMTGYERTSSVAGGMGTSGYGYNPLVMMPGGLNGLGS